jgi:hypothetical protein
MSAFPPSSPPPDQFYIPPPRRTGLATTSLVLGLLSIPMLCICVGPLVGLIAAVCGLIALINAKSKPALFGGAGRAVGGMITGGLSLLSCAAIPVLFISGAASSLPLLKEFAPAISTAIHVQSVAQGLQQYIAEFDASPPDLQTLVSSGKLASNALAAVGNNGMAFIPDVSRGDPGDWIAAYAQVPMLGQVFYMTVRANGTTDFLEAQEFQAAWSRFSAEYAEIRGVQPKAVGGAPPPAPAPASPGDGESEADAEAEAERGDERGP